MSSSSAAPSTPSRPQPSKPSGPPLLSGKKRPSSSSTSKAATKVIDPNINTDTEGRIETLERELRTYREQIRLLKFNARIAEENEQVLDRRLSRTKDSLLKVTQLALEEMERLKMQRDSYSVRGTKLAKNVETLWYKYERKPCAIPLCDQHATVLLHKTTDGTPHVVCQECMGGLVSSLATTDTFNCPFCRHEIGLCSGSPSFSLVNLDKQEARWQVSFEEDPESIERPTLEQDKVIALCSEAAVRHTKSRVTRHIYENVAQVMGGQNPWSFYESGRKLLDDPTVRIRPPPPPLSPKYSPTSPSYNPPEDYFPTSPNQDSDGLGI